MSEANKRNEDIKRNFDEILKENEIASKLISKPGESTKGILISGYVAKSDDPENTVRLYTDLNFDVYVDIPRKDIVEAIKSNDPFQKIYLWIDKGSQLPMSLLNLQYDQPNIFLKVVL